MRWIALLTMLVSLITAAVLDGDMELLLVQAIWRHGDRAPTKTFPTDPFQEGNWTFGGGGFGQLSPIGMKQHMNFGKLLRRVYIDEMKFLSKKYSSSEIYVRSTDRNRTIISAMSNMLGMYGQKDGDAVADVDYPHDDGWPVGFVPIAIHTVDSHTDYAIDPDAKCARKDSLWEMAKSSPEVQAFANRPDVVSLLANLTKFCGQVVNIDNIWTIRDVLLAEQIHANDTLRTVNKWFSDELFSRITLTNNQIDDYENGIFNETLIMNNLDIGKELQKIRGGTIFNEINTHMNLKFGCLNDTSSNCKWINGLKYYVYSAHDTTIYAFFTILGIQSKVIHPSGYPTYSAATFIELWRNRTNNKPYFKLRYHQNDRNVTLYPITQVISSCEGQLYCSLDVFAKFAERSKPDQPIIQWCSVDPRVASSGPSLWTSITSAFITISSTWMNS